MNVNRLIINYINSLPSLEGKRVAHIPCGNNWVISDLAEKRGAEVLNFDLFPESYNKDKGQARFADLSEELPLSDESVDMVICQEGIEHLPNQLFAIQEFHRVLKNRGELLITTPNISNFAGRAAQFIFESQLIRSSPESVFDGIWKKDKGMDNSAEDRYCYGHIFLIGIQRLRTLLNISGFGEITLMKVEISKSSLLLSILFYPVIIVMSFNVLFRDYIKHRKDERLLKEKYSQFRANIAPRTLLNKKLFIVSRKIA
jgi:SAM-dependent methyltransferase